MNDRARLMFVLILHGSEDTALQREALSLDKLCDGPITQSPLQFQDWVKLGSRRSDSFECLSCAIRASALIARVLSDASM